MLDSRLAEIFDQYADQLYVYCRFLLREPADAVDTLEHAFLILAATPDDDLPAPELTRAWLFAVIRNECLRLVRSGKAVAAKSPEVPAPEPGYDDADADPALMRAAIRGLGAAEADLMGLFWHGLDIPDSSEVLNLASHDALALLSRARDHLEAAVTRLLSARTGRPAAEFRARAQQTLTFGALPGSALTADAMRYAGSVTVTLRHQVLDLAAEEAVSGTTAVLGADRTAGPLRENGLPKPQSVGTRKMRRWIPITATVAAAVTGVIVATVIVVQNPGSSSANTGLAVGMDTPSSNPVVAVPPSSMPASPSASPSSASPSSSPSPSRTAPSPSKSPAKSASASPSVSPKPAPGRLLLSTASVHVQDNAPPASVTLAAAGGAVSWSATVDGSHHVFLSSSSGTLQAGQSITIRISTDRSFPTGTISFTAGGQTQQVTVNGG